MLRSLTALFLLVVSIGTADTVQIRPRLLTDTYVPLVIIGEGWSQQIIVKNVDEQENVAGTLKFFTTQGEPWRVDLVDRGPGDTFFVTLRPGQMAVYETVVRDSPQVLGFAYMDTNCCPYVLAQTVFRKQTPGRPDLMTSLAVDETSLKALHIPFDNRNGKFAGVGILTTDSCFSFRCETSMRMTFRDEQGNIFHQVTTTQRNRTLRWFSLSADYPQVVGRLGSLEITSADSTTDFISLVGFSLQFAPNGAFTAIATAER